MENFFYFDTLHKIFLLSGLSFLVLSLIFYQNKKIAISIFLLLLGAVSFRIFIISLDPFINLWDEQYHALVAKNMITSPFVPMLFKEPVLPYNYQNWTENHIWVHKQPLFLWQIAIAIKLFGTNEIAVRLPSLIMTTLIVLLIYRIGILTLNDKIGYYAAWLFALSNYHLDLVSGLAGTDHNDIAFLFYITASIWAWIEYNESHKKSWVILIGLFAGMAVLVKWLTGTLVYLGWALTILLDKQKRFQIKSYIDVSISALITALTFLPWQLYIFYNFHKESVFEFSRNSQHYTEVIEGHEGNAWFHFDKISLLYEISPYIVIIALFFFIRQLKSRTYRVSFLFSICSVYVFFSFAATKMISYCIIVSPLIFLAIGALLHECLKFIEKIKYKYLSTTLITIIVLFIGINFLNIKKIRLRHTMQCGDDILGYRISRVNNVKVYKNLSSILPSRDYVIFNCKHDENILIMFYTNYTAYNFMASYDDYKELKEKDIKIAVFDDGKLPDYIMNDATVYKINAKLF